MNIYPELFSPSSTVYFCESNATKIIPRTINSKDLSTPDAFEKMFSEENLFNEKK